MNIEEGRVSLVELIERGRLGAGVGAVKLRPDILASFIHDAAHAGIPRELRAKTRHLARILSHPELTSPKYPLGIGVCEEIVRIAKELGTVHIPKDLEAWATWVGTAQELLETSARAERTLQ